MKNDETKTAVRTPQPYGLPPKQGLYDPQFEHDSCGVGFVVNIKGAKSHEIIRQALQILINLRHRGACGCETNTGDGAGILLQMPHKFFEKECPKAGIKLPAPGEYGVGIVFLPMDAQARKSCEQSLEKVIAEEGQTLLGWRDVPMRNETLGSVSKSTQPFVRQVFVGRNAALKDVMALERKLFVIRARATHEIRKEHPSFYVPSFSYRTLIYKGMLMSEQVDEFYPDLADPAVESALALVHSRFSTNTFPSWQRAHPYRFIAHNGEINTLRGNINWMHARESLFESELFGEDIKKVLPIIDTDGSDSAMFDNCLEFLVLAGRSLPHAVMMMIPEPWANHETMSDEKKAFYEYHSCLMEPWDGPASIAFTDGTQMGAVLDRNGLRPSRYYVTKDDLVIMASEVGVLDIPPERVLTKGRLQPGRMFLVDTAAGRIIGDEELKNRIVSEQPYRKWLDEHMVELGHVAEITDLPEPDHNTVVQRQQAFGYTWEDLRILMAPMAQTGVEAVGSMGTDTPLAVLSDKPQLLYNYFKQLFAQVTNPPIDCIREEIITSAETTIGAERNLLKPEPESCRLIELKSPVLTNEELAKLRHIKTPGFKSLTLPILFKAAEGERGLAAAMENLNAGASQAIKDGYNILILSDRGKVYRKVRSGEAAVFDASDLNEIKKTYVFDSSSLAMAGSEDLACFLDSGRVLHVLDMIDPFKPIELATLSTEEPYSLSFALRLSGEYLFLLRPDGSTRLFELADPKAPISAGVLPENLSVVDAQVRGHLAFLAAGSLGFRIYDLTRAEKPELVGSFPAVDYFAEIALVGRFVYLKDPISGIFVLDVSQPQTPILVARYEGKPSGMAIAGNQLVVAQDELGLMFFPLLRELRLSASKATQMEGVVRLDIERTPNTSQVVQKASGVGPAVWVDISTNSGPENSFRVFDQIGNGSAFYRVVQE